MSCGCSPWCSETIKWEHQRSLITDQCNKYNNDSLKCCENYQNVSQREEVNQCCWINGIDILAQCRVATDFQVLKKK